MNPELTAQIEQIRVQIARLEHLGMDATNYRVLLRNLLIRAGVPMDTLNDLAGWPVGYANAATDYTCGPPGADPCVQIGALIDRIRRLGGRLDYSRRTGYAQDGAATMYGGLTDTRPFANALSQAGRDALKVTGGVYDDGTVAAHRANPIHQVFADYLADAGDPREGHARSQLDWDGIDDQLQSGTHERAYGPDAARWMASNNTEKAHIFPDRSQLSVIPHRPANNDFELQPSWQMPEQPISHLHTMWHPPGAHHPYHHVMTPDEFDAWVAQFPDDEQARLNQSFPKSEPQQYARTAQPTPYVDPDEADWWRALAENPGDRNTLAVFVDWAQERGHPLAELLGHLRDARIDPGAWDRRKHWYGTAGDYPHESIPGQWVTSLVPTHFPAPGVSVGIAPHVADGGVHKADLRVGGYDGPRWAADIPAEVGHHTASALAAADPTAEHFRRHLEKAQADRDLAMNDLPEVEPPGQYAADPTDYAEADDLEAELRRVHTDRAAELGSFPPDLPSARVASQRTRRFVDRLRHPGTSPFRLPGQIPPPEPMAGGGIPYPPVLPQPRERGPRPEGYVTDTAPAAYRYPTDDYGNPVGVMERVPRKRFLRGDWGPHHYAADTAPTPYSAADDFHAILSQPEHNETRWGTGGDQNLRQVAADAYQDEGDDESAHHLRHGGHVVLTPDRRVKPGRFDDRPTGRAARALGQHVSNWSGGQYDDMIGWEHVGGHPVVQDMHDDNSDVQADAKYPDNTVRLYTNDQGEPLHIHHSELPGTIADLYDRDVNGADWGWNTMPPDDGDWDDGGEGDGQEWFDQHAAEFDRLLEALRNAPTETVNEHAHPHKPPGSDTPSLFARADYAKPGRKFHRIPAGGASIPIPKQYRGGQFAPAHYAPPPVQPAGDPDQPKPPEAQPATPSTADRIAQLKRWAQMFRDRGAPDDHFRAEIDRLGGGQEQYADDAVGDKISRIMHEGIRGKKVPQKQAVAIALSMKRRGELHDYADDPPAIQDAAGQPVSSAPGFTLGVGRQSGRKTPHGTPLTHHDVHDANGDVVGDVQLHQDEEGLHVHWAGMTGAAGGEGRRTEPLGRQHIRPLMTQLAQHYPDAATVSYVPSAGRLAAGAKRVYPLGGRGQAAPAVQPASVPPAKGSKSPEWTRAYDRAFALFPDEAFARKQADRGDYSGALYQPVMYAGEFEALRRAIRAEPDAVLHRHALADWLQEQGRDDEAAFAADTRYPVGFTADGRVGPGHFDQLHPFGQGYTFDAVNNHEHPPGSLNAGYPLWHTNALDTIHPDTIAGIHHVTQDFRQAAADAIGEHGYLEHPSWGAAFHAARNSKNPNDRWFNDGPEISQTLTELGKSYGPHTFHDAPDGMIHSSHDAPPESVQPDPPPADNYGMDANPTNYDDAQDFETFADHVRADQNDVGTRNAFSDWLRDRGRDDEADRLTRRAAPFAHGGDTNLVGFHEGRVGPGHVNQLDPWARSYLGAALDTETDDNGEALSEYHHAGTIHPDTIAAIHHTTNEFRQRAGHALAGHDDPADYGPFHFLTTRNNHGTGFWAHPEYWNADDGSGNAPDYAAELSDHARAMGEHHFYVGDDGMVHSHMDRPAGYGAGESPALYADGDFEPHPADQFAPEGGYGPTQPEPEYQSEPEYHPVGTGEALLSHLHAHPDDQNHRLVTADWMDENGRPDEARRLRDLNNPVTQRGGTVFHATPDEMGWHAHPDIDFRNTADPRTRRWVLGGPLGDWVRHNAEYLGGPNSPVVVNPDRVQLFTNHYDNQPADITPRIFDAAARQAVAAARGNLKRMASIAQFLGDHGQPIPTVVREKLRNLKDEQAWERIEKQFGRAGITSGLPRGFVSSEQHDLRGTPPPGAIWTRPAYKAGKWSRPADSKRGRALTLDEIKARVAELKRKAAGDQPTT